MKKYRMSIFLISLCLCGVMILHPGIGAATDNELVIGLIGPSTGSMASYGLTITRGAEAAIDYINSQGGILGKKLKLVIRDDQLKATTSVQMIQQLIFSEKAIAIISAQSSGAYAASMPLIKRENVPFILTIPTGDSALDGMPSVFRIQITAGQCVMKMADYGYKTYKGKKLGLLGYEGPSGDEADKVAKEFCAKLGIGYIYVQQKYGAGEDLVAQAIKLRDAGVDFVHVYSTVA
ncbi:MAG: ABC transporter substrate-binding protein [Thermodesulfobacteriota bacterium]